MEAAASGTIRSSFYHPEHLLTGCQYGEGSTHPCAACELTIAGTAGYRCEACGFNIHQACFSGLPGSISLQDGHPGHKLALTRLRGSRGCDLCGEISSAGAYMYSCAPCNYDVHPRCTSLVAAQQGQQGGRRDGRRRRRAIKVGLKIGFIGLNILTGGSMSPVLDAIIEAAVDGI